MDVELRPERLVACLSDSFGLVELLDVRAYAAGFSCGGRQGGVRVR